MSSSDKPSIVAVLDRPLTESDVLLLKQNSIEWLEWRFDLISQPFDQSIASILNMQKKGFKVIGTWRENGMNFFDRLAFLKKISTIVDMIDIEQDSFFFNEIVRQFDSKVSLIASFHDYHSVPSVEEMFFRLRESESVQGVFKCVVSPQNLAQFERFLMCSEKMTKLNKRVIMMCMGDYAGEISRLISLRSPNVFVYGCLDCPVVSGQVSVFDLCSFLSVD